MAETVTVSIELTGFKSGGSRISLEVEAVINIAVLQVKKKLVENGLTSPYQLYWNSRFIGGDRSSGWTDAVADGDVFKVIPVVSGG